MIVRYINVHLLLLLLLLTLVVNAPHHNPSQTGQYLIYIFGWDEGLSLTTVLVIYQNGLPVFYLKTNQVDSAFYPPWDGKMSSNLFTWVTEGGDVGTADWVP